jgi:hypothetical protein
VIVLTKKDTIEGKIKALYSANFSIAEVAEELNMSPSGIRYHLVKNGVNIRKRSDAVRVKHNKKLNSHSSHIPKNIPINLQKIYFIGLSLYWGEGSKTGNTVAITNSDPSLILSFLVFLRKICLIDEKRLHILIHYHENQNEDSLIRHWSEICKIPKAQFYKSSLHKKSSKKSTNYLKFGTISLRYADTVLFNELLIRIEQLKIVNKPE